MEFTGKILTKNGIDNTNIDGARLNYFIAGMRDGIFKGSLNEGRFVSSSNTITLDSGVFMIGGQIIINEASTQTFNSTPATNTRYALVGQVVVDSSSNVTFDFIIQTASTPLIKNNLFATENGAGTYQVEIGRFTLTTTGTVTDVTRSLDVITGGSSGMGEHFIVGTITTVMLDAGMDANVTAEDIYDANGNYQQTNFVFEIPETAGTVVKVNNVEQPNIDFDSDPQTQLNNKVDKVEGKGLSENDYTTAEQNKLAGIEAEANKTVVDNSLSSTSTNPVQNSVITNALPNPTLLINGDFRINQRGKTSYTTSDAYTVDRWHNNGLTIDKQYTNRITINSTSQNVGYFAQSIPLEIDQLYGKTITISADVRAITVPSGKSIKLYLENCSSMTGTASRFWESDEITTTGKVSFTVTLPDVLSSTLLVAAIRFAGGSGSSITLNYIKVELGDTATPFIPEVRGVELILCQRYYRRITSGAYSIFGTGIAYNNKRIEIFISHPTSMRKKDPTFSYSGALRLTQKNASVGMLSDNTLSLSLDSTAGTYDSVVIRADLTNALSSFDAGFILQSSNDTSAYLEFDAEIY